jgi:hypothetical protein
MAKEKEDWRIYPSKSHGVMIEYHDLSGKLLLALNYKPEQARELADQILSAVENRQNGSRRAPS